MDKLIKKFRFGQKGFTLVELLVVVAILGVLSAVAVPNVGSFINRGKTEARAAELHNVQTAVLAMLADSATGLLDAVNCAAVNDPASGATPTNDLSTVLSTDATPKVLSNYMTGLNGTLTRTGCSYAFNTTGAVIQQYAP